MNNNHSLLVILFLAVIGIFGCILIHFESIDSQFQIIINRLILTTNDDITSDTKTDVSSTIMPFHTDTEVSLYSIKLKESIQHSESKRRSRLRNYNYLMIRFNERTIEYYLNTSPNWSGGHRTKWHVSPDTIQFNNKEDELRINGFGASKHTITKIWMWLNPAETNAITVPIKVGLQRLQVLTHAYMYNIGRFPLPLEVLEDGMTLATLDMITFSKKFTNETLQNDNLPIYGGKIIKSLEIKPVMMATELADPHPKEISVGPLMISAWKYEDIFVISIRGTFTQENWAINLKQKSKEIRFKGYNLPNDQDISGYIHSGMYDVVNHYLSDIMKIFDYYNNEHRIIITGISLGSGLSQVLLLQLLDMNNEERLTQTVRDIIYGKSEDEISPSLEVISFGGPAIMDGTLGQSLKVALDDFNDRNGVKMMYKPNPLYSALVYLKPNDVIGFTGDKVYEVLKDVLQDKIWEADASKMILRQKAWKGLPINRFVGLDGLKDIKRYRHFGKVVSCGSSPFNAIGPISENMIRLLGHTEYLEAHAFGLGKIGWY